LQTLSPTFDAMYDRIGRPSIPPEHLLKAMLLQSFYSIRSERQLCERLRYDLLFKWFLGLNITDDVFDHATFSKNRDRLLQHEVAAQFFAAVREEARRRRLLSSDHFTVDGTLLDAWASMKRVQPRDGGEPPAGGGKNPSVDFHRQRRTNETHASTTDPDARLARKADGQTTRLAYAGHVLMENRTGLVVDILITGAMGRAEREAALTMLDRQRRSGRITLGADKGYDTADFIADCRARDVTPHVAAHHQPAQQDRCARHQASRLCGEPARAQTRRRDLRLGEDRRRWPEAPLHRRREEPALGAHDRRRLQPRAHGAARTGTRSGISDAA